MWEGRLIYTDPDLNLVYTYDVKEESLEDIIYFIKKLQKEE